MIVKLLIIIYFIIAFIVSYKLATTSIYEKFSDSPEIKTYDMIVARYNEDISWVKDDPFNKFNIICYNKGQNDIDESCVSPKCKIIKLENVGREAHTYLYHILENYDNLAPVTLFVPGSTVSHRFKYNIIIHLIKLINETKTTTLIGSMYDNIRDNLYDSVFEDYKISNENNKTMNPETRLEPSPIRPFGKWYEEVYGDVDIQVFCHFAIFAVAKEHIIQHPKERYEKLIKYLDSHSNPEVAHYMERTWAAVFYPYPDSCVSEFYHG
jgi:hypothetical protein